MFAHIPRCTETAASFRPPLGNLPKASKLCWFSNQATPRHLTGSQLKATFHHTLALCSPQPPFVCLFVCSFVPQVVSSQFTKSVIRSRAALTYAEAQSRIDDERLTDDLSVRAAQGSGRECVFGLRPASQPACLLRRSAACPPANGPSPDSPQQVNLRTMNQLAKILRQKRADRGALSVRRAWAGRQ